MSRRYSAFISYRHADNTQEGRRWAEWLHRGLEVSDHLGCLVLARASAITFVLASNSRNSQCSVNLLA